jgi:hypothetical protein
MSEAEKKTHLSMKLSSKQISLKREKEKMLAFFYIYTTNIYIYTRICTQIACENA